MSSGTRCVLGLVIYHIGDIFAGRLRLGPVGMICVAV